MYHNMWEVYWWSGTKKDIVEFVAKYATFQQVKVEHERLGGTSQEFGILT